MRTLVLTLFIAVSAVPTTLFSHGAEEIVVEKDGYRIELSSTEPFPLVLSESIRMSFDLFSATSTEKENMEGRYDRVWIRVSEGDTIHLATWLVKPTGLLSGFTYIYPRPGTYDITARFARGETVLTEASFEVPVSGEEERGMSPGYAFLISGAGFLLGVLITKKFAK
jgi:hypothetical protein